MREIWKKRENKIAPKISVNYTFHIYRDLLFHSPIVPISEDIRLILKIALPNPKFICQTNQSGALYIYI